MLELAFECESQLFMLWVVLYMIFAFNVFMFMCACFCIMYSLSEIEWAFFVVLCHRAVDVCHKCHVAVQT